MTQDWYRETNLRGKTALVTGGGRGIGKAIALLLAERGARVMVTARTSSEIQAVAAEIEQAGGEARAMTCDVSSDTAVQGLLAASGRVDILINNAGIIEPIAPVVGADPATWQRDIAINLTGVFLTCHYALPGMLERGWGRIVNVSSGAARGTTSGWSAYSSAKAGVEALTGVLAREVGKRGIHVNAIRPGKVDTDMQVEIRGSSEENFGRENLQLYRGYSERGLLRDPRDPARLILWLLSPAADDLNGEVLAIDDPAVASRVGLQPVER